MSLTFVYGGDIKFPCKILYWVFLKKVSLLKKSVAVDRRCGHDKNHEGDGGGNEQVILL